jgi:hypothetical protein
MGPAAFLAIPGVAPAIGAGLSGFFGWLGSRSQAKATRQAADIHARAARTTGAWQERVAGEQLDFQRDEAENLRIDTERAQAANWAMERAREKRLYGQYGDQAFNVFGLTRHERRLGFDERAANRENEYGRWRAQQGRVGRLAELVGTPQPAGGREIPALVRPEWVTLDDPRQTAFEYPDYVPPTTEV